MRRQRSALRMMASVVLVWCGTVAAGEAIPVTYMTTNQNPFIQIHSIPWPSQAVHPDAGSWGAGLTIGMANNSISEESDDGRHIVIDGEVWRGELAFAYGIGPRLELGAVVPVVSHQGGLFDGVIRRWHDLFGLTNSRRDEFEDYSLEYIYMEAGEARFVIDGATTGIGDIRLTGAWHWRKPAASGRSLTLRGGVKLPSGSASRLHGSGGTDLSLQVMSIDTRSLSRWQTTLTWMVGALWLGDGDVLDDLRRDQVAIGSLGVVRPVWRRLLFKAQIDAHSAFYDSDLAPLGKATAQLAFGGGLRIGERGMIDLGFVESLFTDTSPDFGIHLGWHHLL